MKTTEKIGAFEFIVDWEQHDVEERIDHSVMYGASGVDQLGNEWEGTWEECCGMDEITESWCITPNDKIVYPEKKVA